MPTDIDLHKIQKDILLTLIFEPNLTFSKLNISNLPSDHFNFHLKQLVGWNLIEKRRNGKYQLTNKGKEFANRMDTNKKIYEKQAKVGILICLIRKKRDATQYLIQKRLKEPYFGYYGYITGKVPLGETVFETAERELKEESNLSANLELKGVKHKMDYSQNNKLLEDKFFFVFKGTNIQGKLKQEFKGGKNIWMAKEKILKLKNLFDGVKESFDMIEGKHLVFSETKYKVIKF